MEEEVKYSATVHLNNDTINSKYIASPEFPTIKEAEDYLHNAAYNKVHPSYSRRKINLGTGKFTVDSGVCKDAVRASDLQGRPMTFYKIHPDGRVDILEEWDGTELIGVRE